MTCTVAIGLLLAVLTLAVLSAAAAAAWLARRAGGQGAQDLDWRETWRRAVDEFKAAGRGGPPAE